MTSKQKKTAKKRPRVSATPTRKTAKKRASPAVEKARRNMLKVLAEAEAELTPKRKRARPRAAVKSTAIAIRAPVGLLPPQPGDVESFVMPAAGALVMPEQPIIALAGLSTLSTTTAEREALMADFPPEQIDIKPSEEVYISHIHLRKRLSIVLGPGAWGMQPMGKATPIEEQWIVVPWALYIRGHALSWTWGGARYRPNNKRGSWSDALETAKSDALSRLCKDIPMAGQCWDRRHNDRFKRDHCVLVYVKTKDGTELWWRTKDRAPFRGEAGAHPESPNLDTYTDPVAAPAQAGSTKASGPRSITDKQAKRLMAIAKEVGWTKAELLRFLKEECKLSPAKNKPADLWHVVVAIPREKYDSIISDVESGTE